MAGRFTLAEVVKRTGAKRRSVQLWADAGVILGAPGTDREGTGTHREFDLAGLRIAALVVPLANMGVPIGMLRRFSAEIRSALLVAGVARLNVGAALFIEEWSPGSQATGKILDRAAKRIGQNYVVVQFSREKLLLGWLTDEAGPVAISPVKVFPPGKYDPRALLGVLDLTGLLGGLGK
jgi:hypothetical protein